MLSIIREFGRHIVLEISSESILLLLNLLISNLLIQSTLRDATDLNHSSELWLNPEIQ